jgi:hypothetical protein
MKFKICSICLKETVLYKSKPPTCKYCSKKPTIKKISDKHKEILKDYKVSKEEFIKEKLSQGIDFCEIKSPVCTHSYQGIHHKKGKSSKELYCDKEYFMLSCNACNLYIEENSEWAYKNNFKLKRNGNN